MNWLSLVEKLIVTLPAIIGAASGLVNYRRLKNVSRRTKEIVGHVTPDPGQNSATSRTH